MDKVIVELCENYRIDRVTSTLEKILKEWEASIPHQARNARGFKAEPAPGEKPDDAATTHPAVIQAIAALVQKAGGLVSIVESPGAL